MCFVETHISEKSKKVEEFGKIFYFHNFTFVI